METVFFRPSSEPAEQIGDMFLLVNRQIILGGSEKDHTTLADSDGQVAKLVMGVIRREYIFDPGRGILAPDGWCHVDIFEMVNR